MESAPRSSTSVSTVTVTGKGRQSRAPPPSTEEVKAGVLLVDQRSKKVNKMRKPLLMAVCCSKFGGNTNDYGDFTVKELILKLVR